MKRKGLLWSFLGLFLALSLVLSVGILLAGPSQAGANEVLSQAPALLDSGGGLNDAFLADAAEWIGDHFFLRQELISLGNAISARLFRTSGNDAVILGSDGWLYYRSTLDDYTGQNAMTERELFCAAYNLQLMAQYCSSEGKAFVFVIAPNKNSVYGENMPDYGVVSQEHDAQKLLTLLAEAGVDTVDLFTAFSQQEEVLYYVTDSHWNAKGAALGADEINRAFGIESDYFGGEFTASETGHTGDLYEMLYPAFSGTETELQYAGTLDFTYASSAVQPDSITLLTTGKGEGTLLAYRDSFGNLLYPYLADSFAAARFSRSTSYDLTREADYVLVELVERNLDYLLRYVPVMPSPAGEVAVPAASGTAAATLQTGAAAPEGYALWRGTLPVTPDTQTTVSLTAQGLAYAAFLTADNGFAVYLPEGVEPEALLLQTGEVLEAFTIQ